MNNQEMLRAITASVGSQDVLPVPRVYISMLDGDVVTALFLSRIIYHTDLSANDGGFFYRKSSQWQEEIGISQHQIDRSTGILKNAGLLETKLMKVLGAPTLHYRLNSDALFHAVLANLKDGKKLAMRKGRKEK